MRPYLLMDAGGTLVFPNIEWISDLLKTYGYKVNPYKVLKGFFEVNREEDESLKIGKVFGEHLWWEKLFSKFVSSKSEVVELEKEFLNRAKFEDLFAYTFDWTKETLRALRNSGYSISVISNYNGTMPILLKKVGVDIYLDKVYDSGLVGFEKPDPRIFERALKELSIEPQNSIFIGDMFYIDVLGANRAGIAAIHLDPFNLYENWPGFRIRSIKTLFKLLRKLDLGSKNLFPFGEIAIE